MPPTRGSELTRRRSRVIAIQALVVGALALIVVVTLLRPESSEPLFGVSTPNDDTDRVVVEYERHDRDSRGGDDRRGGGEGSGRGDLALTGPAGASSTAVGFAGATASGSTPPAPAPDEGSDGERGSPTGDQYGDTLARLAAKLQ